MDRFVKKRKRVTEDKEDGTTNQAAGVSKVRKKEGNVNINTDSAVAKSLKWQQFSSENLDCRYTILYSKAEADNLISECERSLTYNTGPMARIFVFGKWRDLPRKQTAHGDDGLTYSYSGKTVAATPWTPLLKNIRDRVAAASGFTFNFVLINR
ncbi:DNA oxidative demethylase ALKBH2-like isoform X2 [Mizuhopecten yessoensis]|nr:DNA oxidative demethylase ALKBH2-like isoform X2 [Mizuhopecten yessoensis]